MRAILFLLLIALLTACEPAPTPFPVDVPVTPTPTPVPTEIPLVRYALGAETTGFVTDYDLIAASAEVEQLTQPINPAQLGLRYDIVATYGEVPGWSRSEITRRVMLVINPEMQPLNMQVGDLLRRAINPQAVVNDLPIPNLTPASPTPTITPGQIRTEFANLGRPDGFPVTMGHLPLPGVEAVSVQLANVNIQARLREYPSSEALMSAFAEDQLQLALVAWTTEAEKQAWVDLTSVDFVLDLFALPISYQAIPELRISFTPDGWPIATRSES